MLYHQKGRQVSYGEAIGILLLDSPVPFVPGDVANATTYDFPVRFRKVPGFTVEKALNRDEAVYRELLEAASCRLMPARCKPQPVVPSLTISP